MSIKKVLVCALAAVQLLAMAPMALAGSKGRLNTAGLLTGAAVYSIYKYGQKGSAGRRNTALLTTAGAAYGWHRYNKAKKSEKRRQRAAAYAAGRRAGIASARRSNRSQYSRSRYSRTRYARR